MARLSRWRQGQRNEGFMQTPLRFYLSSLSLSARSAESKNKQTYKQIRIIQSVCLSYLDIHSRHLNQAVLTGPHPLLIETQAVPDNLICLRNGGDINSTWLRQWPLLLLVLNPSSTSLYLHSLESLCVQSLFISSFLSCSAPSIPPSLHLMIQASWQQTRASSTCAVCRCHADSLCVGNGGNSDR